MIGWLLGLALAGGPEDVREPIGDGIAINWTRMVVESTASQRGAGVGATQKAVEQRARDVVGPALIEGVSRVRVRDGDTFADLVDRGELGTTLEARLNRWSVVEGRYFASGKVEIDAELPLQELLKPWTLDVAQPAGDRSTDWTGAVIDARGLDVRPAFAPKVVTAGGEVLWDGSLDPTAAVDSVPVVYAPSAAHPKVAEHAGGRPLLVQARSAKGAAIVLSDEAAAAFRDGLVGTDVLGRGTVVVLCE